MYGVRILQGVIAEGEALVMWFGSIKAIKSEAKDSRLR